MEYILLKKLQIILDLIDILRYIYCEVYIKMSYTNLTIKNKKLKDDLKIQAIKENVTVIELVEKIIKKYLSGKNNG